MSLIERITINPDVCHGKPTIRGLRYPVELILELLSSGMTTDEIPADYEDLEKEDILALRHQDNKPIIGLLPCTVKYLSV